MSFIGDRPRLVLALMALISTGIVASLLAMDPGIRQRTVDVLGYGGAHSDETYGGRDLFHTGVPIRGEKGGESYAAYDARRDAVASMVNFRGFGCADSCDAHAEGYRWAGSKQIARPRDCQGPTWQFVEGCTAYTVPKSPNPQ